MDKLQLILLFKYNCQDFLMKLFKYNCQDILMKLFKYNCQDFFRYPDIYISLQPDENTLKAEVAKLRHVTG